MIEFHCSCGKRFKVDSQRAGKTAKCRVCGASIKIPLIPAATMPSPQPAAPRPDHPGAAPAEAQPVAAAARAKGRGML